MSEEESTPKGVGLPNEEIIGVNYTADTERKPDKVIRVKDLDSGLVEDRSRNQTIKGAVKAGTVRAPKPVTKIK